MQTVRDVILAKAKKMGLDAAGLCKLVEGRVHRKSIYNLMNAGGEVNTNSLAVIMEALGLQIMDAPDARPESKSTGKRVHKRKQT